MILPPKQSMLFVLHQQWFFGEIHGNKWLIVLNLQPIEKNLGVWVPNIYLLESKRPKKRNPIPVLRVFTDRFGRIDTNKIHKILGEGCRVGTNRKIKSARRICGDIRKELEEQFFKTGGEEK